MAERYERWDSNKPSFCGFKKIIWVDKNVRCKLLPNNWEVYIKCLKCDREGLCKSIKIMSTFCWRWQDIRLQKLSNYYFGCEMCGENYNSSYIKIFCYRCGEFNVPKGESKCDLCRFFL